MSKELAEQSKKLLEFLANDPEGKLLLSSLSDYGIMALTYINPPLGTAVDVALSFSSVIDADQGILSGVALYAEHKLAHYIGTPAAKVAAIKVKQMWEISQLPRVQLAFKNFHKNYIFQKDYAAYKGNPADYSKHFEKDVMPTIPNIFRKALEERFSKNIPSTNLVQDLDAGKLKDAVNKMLAEKTIDGLDLNLDLPSYQEQLSPDVLDKFNYEVDHIVGTGVERYQEVVLDENIKYLEIDGTSYIGHVNENNLPHGEGILVTENGVEKTVWDNGVQVKSDSAKGGSFMLELPAIAAIVSIISGLYGMDRARQQTAYLEIINNVLEGVMKYLQNMPQHIAAAFDAQTTMFARADYYSIISLSAVKDLTRRGEAIEKEFDSTREKLKDAYNLLKQSPQGNNKLQFAQDLYVCTNNLVATVILAYMYLPDHIGYAKALLNDVIPFLNQYVKDVPKHIDDRFGNFHLSIEDVPPSTPGGEGRRKIYGSYFFDGQEIVVIDQTKKGGADSNYYRNLILNKRQEHKNKLAEVVKPTIPLLEGVIGIARDFLIGYVLIDILGDSSDLTNKNLSYTLSELNAEEIKDLKILLGTKFPKIQYIDPQSPSYKKISFVREEIQELKKELDGKGDKKAKALSAKLVKDYVSCLYDDGYDALRSKIGMSEEGKKRAEKTYENLSGNKLEKQEEIDHWAEFLSKNGYIKLCEEIANNGGAKKRIDETFKERFDKNTDRNTWIQKLAELGWGELSMQEAKRFHVSAKEHVNKNQFHLAINDLMQAIKLNPNFAESYRYLGLSYLRLGEEKAANGVHDEARKLFENAVDAYSKAIKLIPDAFQPYLSRSACYLNLNKYAEAAKDLEKTIEIDPKCYVCHHNLGDCYRHLERYKEAIRAYDTATQLAADEPKSYYYRAHTYYATGDYKKAVEDYDTAIQKGFGQYYWSYQSRGEAQAKLNNHADALKDFRSAFNLKMPGDPIEFFRKWGDKLREADNYNDAIQYYQESINRGSANSLTYHNIGECYLKLEKYDLAAHAYKYATESLKSTNPWSYHHLGDCYIHLDKQERPSKSIVKQ
jgi:tetratricopeptide (TPR) repeat protein